MSQDNTVKPLTQKQINKRIQIILENDGEIPEELPSEFTIVRVWTSEYHRNRSYNTRYIFCWGDNRISRTFSSSPVEGAEDSPGIGEGDSKGHVSMELITNRQRGTKDNSSYLSFGPKEDYPENSLETHEAKFIDNYRNDLKYMERKPNYTIILYSLDVILMKTTLKDLFQIKNIKWTLIGPRCNMGNVNDSFLTKTYKRIRFCWWAMFQLLEILDKLPFHRKLVDTENEEHDIIDPTADMTPDENGEITMSCVSAVFYVLHKGNFTNLLPLKEQRRAIAGAVSEVSSDSVVNILQVNLEKVLRNAGYIFHLGISSVVINPDAFLCIIKYAKKREMKRKLRESRYNVVFRNDSVDFPVSSGQVTVLDDKDSVGHSVVVEKKSVTVSEWVPNLPDKDES